MLTKEQYNQTLDSMNEEDWKNLKGMMEKKLPMVKDWEDSFFKNYSTALVRSGFRRNGLN